MAMGMNADLQLETEDLRAEGSACASLLLGKSNGLGKQVILGMNMRTYHCIPVKFLYELIYELWWDWTQLRRRFPLSKPTDRVTHACDLPWHVLPRLPQALHRVRCALLLGRPTPLRARRKAGLVVHLGRNQCSSRYTICICAELKS